MCIFEDCSKRSCYNYETEDKPLYCSEHRKNGMVNLINKKCLHPDCKVIPNYNYENETKSSYCASHKLSGMVNITSKRCLHPDCNVQPNYNYENETKSLYCAKHKLTEMVNITNKTCLHPDCKVIPCYNYENETKALYCAKHKLTEMVNIINKSCLHPDCKVRPNYNYENETNASYCSKHKLSGMIDVKNKKCLHPNCKVQPNYNYEGEKRGLYCYTHKLTGMINIISKTCKTHLCSTHVSEKYDGYCLYCYINLFPEKPVSRNYKTKEYAVVEFVKASFPELSWVSDKKITDGCSKRRPDLFLDLGYQILIIEIDENQHLDYDCSCENKRIMELSQDVGHKPIVFIRFNPDEYYNDEIVISSCWGIDKKGISVVKKSKDKEWEKRLNTLKEQVVYWIHPDNITAKTVEIIQLFFDSGELRVPP